VSLDQRRIRKIRLHARAAFIKSGGSVEDAISLFQEDAEMRSIDPAMIALIVQIAIAFFEYWSSRNLTEPSVVADLLEPYIMEESNDAD
jgi:hypothetical protein